MNKNKNSRNDKSNNKQTASKRAGPPGRRAAAPRLRGVERIYIYIYIYTYIHTYYKHMSMYIYIYIHTQRLCIRGLCINGPRLRAAPTLAACAASSNNVIHSL